MKIVLDTDHEVEKNKTAKYKDGYLQSFLSKLLANRKEHELREILSYIAKGCDFEECTTSMMGIDTTNGYKVSNTEKVYYMVKNEHGMPIGTIDVESKDSYKKRAEELELALDNIRKSSVIGMICAALFPIIVYGISKIIF